MKTTNKFASHPLLVLYRCQGEPLRRYLSEILIQEGYFCNDEKELDKVKNLTQILLGRALVIISASSFKKSEIKIIADFVHNGGRIIFIRPPRPMLEALNLSISRCPDKFRANGALASGYLHIKKHPWTGNHPGTCIQLHSPVLLGMIENTLSMAAVSTRKDQTDGISAILEGKCGKGHITVFNFDPATSILITRQGIPPETKMRWPDVKFGEEIKPGKLFYNLLDLELCEIPQADIMADLLVGIIRGMTEPTLPLPKVWHMPDNTPALTLLDGDMDAYNWEGYEKIVSKCMKKGIPYTCNIMSRHFNEFDWTIAEKWIKQGNDFELHYWPESNPSVEEYAKRIKYDQNAFRKLSGGLVSVGGRSHCIIWPGYTEPAEILAKNNFQLETNFFICYNWPYGYFGSARAARFMTIKGKFVPLLQQPGIFMDDSMSNGCQVPALSPKEAYMAIMKTYKESADKYHGVINSCLHPAPKSYWNLPVIKVQEAMLDAIIDATKKHRLKAMTVRNWCAFQKARRAVNIIFKNGNWQIKIPQPAPGLTVHLPSQSGTRRQGFTWKIMTLNKK